MTKETNPYPEEDELLDDTETAVIAILALSFLYAVKDYEQGYKYQDVQARFRYKIYEAIPELEGMSKKAIDMGLERVGNDYGLPDLYYNHNTANLPIEVKGVLDDNISYINTTNRVMVDRLLQISDAEGWSDEELTKRMKRYFGLTPQHLKTIVNMEKALREDGVGKKAADKMVQKRINKLVDWRMELITSKISTGVLGASKDESFGYLINTGQINLNEYEKVWKSVIDEDTTDICTSSHNTRAPIGGTFPNGLKHPPAAPPIHPCRSTITLAKRIL